MAICLAWLWSAMLIGAQPIEATITIGRPHGAVRKLLGVNAGPLVFNGRERFDLTAQYRRYGVAQVRTHDYYGPLDMAVMYPNQEADPDSPTSYNFAESDRAFRAILDGGFEPYLRIGDSWNIGPEFGRIRRRAPANRANWVRAAVHVVRRYRDMAGDRHRYVEVWNEPNHPTFWDSTPDAFVPLFVETVRAIKTAFPMLKVGGPGMAHSAAVLPRGRSALTVFLQGIAGRCRPDFFSWHIYSNRPEQYREIARFYRAELDRCGFKGMPQHVTEYHTDERERPEGLNMVALRVGSAGAAIVTASWIAMQMEGIEEATLYRGSDVAPDQTTFYGMLRSDGTPKGPGLAFEFWSRLAATRERLDVAVGGADTRTLWCLAGRTDKGAVRMLIANTGRTPVRWTLRLPAAQSSPGMTIEEIRNDGVRPAMLKAPGLRAMTPGYTAQLVTIEGAGSGPAPVGSVVR